jgi:regulatory protein
MKITKIAKKDASNVVVEFENGDPLFLSVEVFMKSGLRKNDEISEDRFLLLVRENRIFYIKQRAFRYLGRRLHSRSELRTKLMQKGYEAVLINVVLDELEQKKYLNDAEFARIFTEEKIESKQWGKTKLKAELIKRGINSDVLSSVLNEVISDEDNYRNALSVAVKKHNALMDRGLDNETIKNKLITFLNSRGFDYDMIKQVCDKLIDEKLA